MNIDTQSLVIRWLAISSVDSPDYRAVFTASLFWDEGAIGEYFSTQKRSTLVRDDIVNAILTIASPIEIACVLWSPVGQALDVQTFIKWTQHILKFGQDFRTQHYLGGAIYDYLRHRPGAFTPPYELMERLLEAPDSDAHIVGIKLAGLVIDDFSQLWPLLSGALNAPRAERLAALYVLVEVLDSQLSGKTANVSVEALPRIRSALTALEESGASHEELHMATLAFKKCDNIEQCGAT